MLSAGMQVIFMGAPDFAVPALDIVAKLADRVVAVYTKEPRPGGRRGLELTKTAVHLRAEALGLRVFTPKSLRSEEAQAEFRALGADIAIVAAYGLILPAPVLAAPRLGCLNLHGSRLPRWRGAAPIQRAIMAGDGETGVDLMRMEEGLDTGPVAAEARIPIGPQDTAGDITTRLATVGAQLLADHWREIAEGRLTFRPQPDEGLLYARKIEKSETPIDWSADAETIRNHIHGLSPAPGAFGLLSGDPPERIKFLRVEAVSGTGAPGEIIGDDFTIACGRGAIRATLLQPAGKTPMTGRELMRGGRIRIDAQFLPAEAARASR